MGVVTASELIVLERVEDAVLAVSSAIAEKGGLSSRVLVVDLDERVDSSSSEKFT